MRVHEFEYIGKGWGRKDDILMISTDFILFDFLPPLPFAEEGAGEWRSRSILWGYEG